MKNILKQIGFASLAVFILSCHSTHTQTAGITTIGSPACIDSSASCTHLTKDNKGNIVLSWIRAFNDSQDIVCYAVSKDSGNTFGTPVEIAPSKNVFPHGENMPKMIFKPDGEIIAAWGARNPNPANKYSGLVYYSQSFDNGKTWNGPDLLTKDTASYDQRYFDLALLPNGQIGIIWLDNRTKTDKEGSSLYFASTDGKNGFANERPIGTTCCPCCRTALFVDKEKNIHITYRAIINDSIRDMVHIVSSDNGKTFTTPQRISPDNWVINGCPHTGPAMTENKNGLQFAWHTGGNGDGMFYCNSADNGKTFSPKDTVSSKPSAKHPQIKTFRDGTLVIVWDETIKNGNKYNAWIGAQLRSPEGKTITTTHLTSNSDVATFPSIVPLSGHTAIVAYTQRIKNNTGIYYQIINTETQQ